MKLPHIATFLVLVGLVFSLNVPQVNAGWEDKYTKQTNRINAEIKKIEDKMAEIAHTIEGLEEHAVTLVGRIETTKQEISTLKKLILETETLIDQKESQIEEKKQDISDLEDDMAGLIRQYQIEKDEGLLINILSSKSLGGFLSKINNLSNVSSKLDNLGEALEREQATLETSLKELETTKRTLNRSEALSRSKRDSLIILQDQVEKEKQYQEDLKNGLIKKENALEESLKVVAFNMAKEKAKMDACLADSTNYYDFESGRCKKKPTNVSGPISGSGRNNNGCVNVASDVSGIPYDAFVNPSYGYITQGFGCTPYGNHDGTDIANSRNTPIVAAAAGKVVKITTNPRVGYGYSLVIKHTFGNRNLYTRYAHLNSLPIVSMGDNVYKGQRVGYMGTTGFSTGVHLHFSITDESYETSRNTNCNPRYGYTSSYCYSPFNQPFDLFN